MSKCKDCKYAQNIGYEIAGIECCTCSLTRRVMNANAESECNCYNRDLSEYDICYNCKYYHGGGDWGLFCSHSDMYHHLGKFSDESCGRYERRQPTVTINDLADEIKVTNCNYNQFAEDSKKVSISWDHENDLIHRADALSCFHDWIDSHGDVHTADEMPEYQRIEQLPPVQPDNQINLCDSCGYSYPDCPSKNDDVIFGNGTGNDNICACNKYKPSAQPEKEIPRRVLWSGWKGTRYTRYKCPNCNKPVKNDDVYCHRCGQKLMFPHISHTPYIEGQKQELIVRWDDEE